MGDKAIQGFEPPLKAALVALRHGVAARHPVSDLDELTLGPALLQRQRVPVRRMLRPLCEQRVGVLANLVTDY
jgi:hypothetical protein